MLKHLVLERAPDSPALIGEFGMVTFGELKDRASRVAVRLRDAGVGPGDRVGLVLPQGATAAVSYLATLWLGAVIVPLSIRESRAGLEDKLQRSQPAVVIAGDEVDVGGATVRLSPDEVSGPVQKDGIEPVVTGRDDPAILAFTSGTTGRARGVLLPHRVLPGRLPGFVLAQEYAPQPGDRFWSPVEWIWVGSLLDSLFTPWALGMPVVADPDRFDPDKAVATVGKFEVRNAFLPPTALRLLAAAGVSVEAPLRVVHSGGEALSHSAIEGSRSVFGVIPNEIYGQSEASFLAGSGGAYSRRKGSLGRPYPGHRLELLDEGGQPVPYGEVGEICVTTDDATLFLGYWGEGPQPNGRWWHTGDLATRDEEGFLYFVSRKDDLIISSGYRVDPVQVEEALMRHPRIAAAGVVAAPDDLRGHVPVAFVSVKGELPLDAELLRQELLRSLSGRIPGYARPREIFIVPELPTTSTGKIARGVLRQVREESSIVKTEGGSYNHDVHT